MSVAIKMIETFPDAAVEGTTAILISKCPLMPIKTQKHYDRAVEFITFLSKVLVENENKIPPEVEEPLLDYFKDLGSLVATYEAEAYPSKPASGLEILKYFMEMHGLTQSDLPEIGKQPQVSRILNGERPLTKRHMERLAKRFGVSPSAFFK
jgi:HTH-type transcriptional regulator/antitoxin HigA